MSRASYIAPCALLAVVCVGMAYARRPSPVRPALQRSAPAPVRTNAPSDEGKVVGKVEPFRLTSAGLRASVRSHPLPKISLAFGAPAAGVKRKSDAKLTLQLPNEARTAITPCWLAYLDYHYKAKMGTVSDPQSKSEEDLAMISVAEATAEGLEKIAIEAPNGRRHLSSNEAYDIVYFLGRAAAGVVEDGKKVGEVK